MHNIIGIKNAVFFERVISLKLMISVCDHVQLINHINGCHT